MSKSNPTAIKQIGELAQKLKNDAELFSAFVTNFISDQLVRIDKYGDGTYFSTKQVDLIERIHAELVRGEVIEKSRNPNAINQVQEIVQKLLQDGSEFSEFESDFINDQIERIKEQGDDAYFSDKQSALIERIHAERVRGEILEKSKGNKSKPQTKG